MRLVVDREREIGLHRRGVLDHRRDLGRIAVDGAFTRRAEPLDGEKARIGSRGGRREHEAALRAATDYGVSDVTRTAATDERAAAVHDQHAPAGGPRKLGFGARRTMRVAQSLVRGDRPAGRARSG